MTEDLTKLNASADFSSKHFLKPVRLDANDLLTGFGLQVYMIGGKYCPFATTIHYELQIWPSFNFRFPFTTKSIGCQSLQPLHNERYTFLELQRGNWSISPNF